jgi:Zn-dependent alcohol dehydrogenase
MNMKLRKGSPLAGWKAFVEACPTCKNQRSNLCKKCKMEAESGYDPKPEFAMTNADRIRAMSDELLASQMVVVVEETIKALTDLDVPDEVLNEVRSQILERLKQPAGDQ